ncbi:hypothetical protein CSQ88_22120, partial [Iodobacter sp. BJB302]
GYYAAQKRSSAAVICVESVNLKAAFEESEQTSGSRRLITAMQTKGFKIGRYKVRRLMQEAGLKPVWKRKFVSTTDSNHALPVAANILNRQFNPEQPNQAWVSDNYIYPDPNWLVIFGGGHGAIFPQNNWLGHGPHHAC